MLPTALLNKVPRPEFHQAFAAVARPYIESWIAGLSKKLAQRAYEEFLATLPKETDDRTLTHLLESLIYGREKLEAFELASNLKIVLGWPSDADLVTTLTHAIDRTNGRGLRALTIEWVMKNMIRFDKKIGEDCIFYDKTFQGNRMGKVDSVDRPVATGVVKMTGGKLVTVLAEHVVS